MAQETRTRPAEEQAVSYEMLQDLLRSERRSNKLMPVAARFWMDVRAFLEAVTAEFRTEQAKDPFSRRVMLLTDEVKNARYAAESLWALRERKLAMLALAATKERKRPDGITPDEAQLYESFLGTLQEARARQFDGLLPPTTLAPPPVQVPSPAPAAPPPVQMPITAAAQPAHTAHAPHAAPASPVPPAAPAREPILAAPLAQASASTASGAPVQVVPTDTGHAVEMVTIRALGDIPPFVGPDMQTYLLKAGDLATVPPSIANLLVRRNKAAIVNTQ